MTPQQITQVTASEQQMFGNIIRAIQQNQQLKLSGRQQTLAERKFESGEVDTVASREALKKLSGFTAETIHKAPADVLATINKTSIGSMFATNNSIRAGQTPTGRNVPADIQVMNVMQEQAKQFGGDITQTDMWKIKTSGKNKEKSRADVKLALAQAKAKDLIFSRMSPEEQRKVIDADTDFILDEPAKRTKDTVLNRTLDAFESAKRNEIIDALMLPAHEPTL